GLALIWVQPGEHVRFGSKADHVRRTGLWLLWPIADIPLTQSPRCISPGQKLPASQQSGMTLASDQDRDTSGKSRTQARSLTHLDRRILSGCLQEQGDIDHVRL